MTTVSALDGYERGRVERSEVTPSKNYAADLQRQKRVDSVQRLNAAHAKTIDAIAKSPSRPNRFNISQAGTLRAPASVDMRETRHEMSKKPERSESLRDAPTCKPRPEKNRGMGTSRTFVPWCDKRKH